MGITFTMKSACRHITQAKQWRGFRIKVIGGEFSIVLGKYGSFKLSFLTMTQLCI